MYIKRLSAVIILSLCLAWLTGMLFDYRYKKRWDYLYFNKVDHLMKNDSNYDVIFLGDSRVHHGINPFYVDSLTELTTYNFGMPGLDGEELSLIASVYLQQHRQPKLVLINIDEGIFAAGSILKQRYSYLSYLYNDTLAAYMQRNGFPGFIKYFPFLKYSFFDDYNRLSVFTRGSVVPQFDHNMYKGFLNVDQFVNNTGKVVFGNSDNESIDDKEINYIKNTIRFLKEHAVDMVLIFPPEKKNSATALSAVKQQADSILNRLSMEYKIPCWRFDTVAVYTKEYFVDDVHLNEPGSRIYSTQIADSILKLMKK